MLDRIDGMIFVFPFCYIITTSGISYEKKIAILGSTGSIGKKTIQILEKNKKNFDILLLTTNKNISTLNAQVKKFKVKNVIVTSKIII